MQTSDVGGDGAEAPRPRSRARDVVRGLVSWMAQWIRWDDRPTAAMYWLLIRERDALEARLARSEAEKVEAQGEAAAARKEIAVLAAVCARNQARVDAETKQAAAQAEEAIIRASRMKSDRLG